MTKFLRLRSVNFMLNMRYVKKVAFISEQEFQITMSDSDVYRIFIEGALELDGVTLIVENGVDKFKVPDTNEFVQVRHFLTHGDVRG